MEESKNKALLYDTQDNAVTSSGKLIISTIESELEKLTKNTCKACEKTGNCVCKESNNKNFNPYYRTDTKGKSNSILTTDNFGNLFWTDISQELPKFDNSNNNSIVGNKNIVSDGLNYMVNDNQELTFPGNANHPENHIYLRKDRYEELLMNNAENSRLKLQVSEFKKSFFYSLWKLFN